MKKLFRTKSQNHDSDSQTHLRRCLTAFDLTMLGIGAIIGAGIFVLTGIAAATQAGPAIILSYLVAAVACGFAALSYAELASSFGGCGGAYGYAYASIGECFAWIIGWDLLLEYGMDAATVSIGWAGYMESFLHAIGVSIPKALSADPFHGGIINLPAVAVILALAGILSMGVKSGARFNSIIVYIKLFAIALFVGIGIFYFNPQNWHPFMPFGAQGIINGAGFIFFAYIGFDAVSTAGEEAINPQKSLPIGIIASLVICTLVYIIVAAILTGVAYYPTLNISSPVAAVLYKLGYKFSAQIIAIGAIAGLTSTIFAMYFGFSRVFLAMARDGLLPKRFVTLHAASQSPRRLIWSAGVVMALTAGLIPIKEVANLVNIGTLAAFAAVCGSVLVLRVTQPNLHRPFKTPFSPVVPLLGVVLCCYLMSSLPLSTWVSFGLWTLGGLVIYFCYSRFNSLLAKPAIASQA
ncbi:MAG: APC family permease [Gammaproteobacteria bacterium]